MNRKVILRIVLALALVAAAWLIYRTLSQYTFDEITASLLAIPARNIALAMVFAACSYACLTLFDYLALHYVGKPLAYPKAALASFTSLSIGHNVGVAALSSGAVRYRFYSRWGLSMEDIAKIILFCGVTVGLGLMTLAGLCLVLLPDFAGRMAGLGAAASRTIGFACLAASCAYVAAAAVTSRREVRLWKWHFALPGPGLAALQIIVGTVNFAFVAACLHQVIGDSAGYLETATAYVTGNLAALISHVPGGLGVLEATVSVLMGGSASIGALLAFRTIYFFIPLPLGLVSLLTSEAVLGSSDAAELPARRS